MSNYYEILNVPKDADDVTIKKAYRKLALQHHPDKGGDPETFAKIQRANEVLSNPEKRKLFDLGGEDALERGHAGGHDHDGMDIFDIFGGGGRRRQQQPRGPTKGPPVSFPLELTLEEMYLGCTKKLRLTRTIACSGCDGKGGSGVTACAPCQGRGVRVVVQRLGPGMISQSQEQCRQCGGEGKVIPSGSECRTCMGVKTVKDQQQLEVTVPRGARADQTSVFVGQGDQQPGQLAGDIIVDFREKPHDRFTRQGHHLFIKHKISLLEALTGFTVYIKQLDGRDLEVTSTGVVSPGDIFCIPDEGFMHSFGNGRAIETGNLYVTFDIQFPTTQQVWGPNNNNKFAEAKKHLTASLPNQSTLPKKPTGGQIQLQKCQSQVVDQNKIDKQRVVEDREWSRFKQQQSSSAHQSRGGQSYDDDDDDGHSMGGMGQPACQQL